MSQMPGAAPGGDFIDAYIARLAQMGRAPDWDRGMAVTQGGMRNPAMLGGQNPAALLQRRQPMAMGGPQSALLRRSMR